jgi:hypothetical protein
MLLLAAAAQGRCDGGTGSRLAARADTVGTVGTVTMPEIVHLLTQQNSAYRQDAELVVRDAAAWAQAWRALHGGVPGEDPPAVDFARHMVVVVATGERSTGGHGVRVDAVAAERSGAVVRYTVTEPGPGCMTTQSITAPVDVVRAPHATGTIRFERRTVQQDC